MSRQGDGLALRWRESEADLLLHPGEGFLDVDLGQRMSASLEPSDADGELSLGTVQRRQVDAVVIADPVPDEPAVADLVVDGGPDNGLLDAKQLDGLPDQAVLGERAMAFVGQLLEGIGDARSRPEWRTPVNAQPSRQLVGGLADADVSQASPASRCRWRRR